MLLSVAVQGLGYGAFHWIGLIGFSFGFWIIFSALLEPVRRLRQGQNLTAGLLGMAIAHLGVGMFAIGASGVESYKIEKDVALKPGGSLYDRRAMSFASSTPSTCAARITMRCRRWWRSRAAASR